MPERQAAPDASRVEMFVTDVRAALAEAADATKAPQMQAYMKSSMPYFGIPSPTLKAVLKPLLADSLGPSWELAVRTLWGEATHREEWYAALALAGHRHYRAYQDGSALSLYEHLIVSGAWWDVVDEIASRRVGALLPGVTTALYDWAVSEDLRLRRSAIICQLRARHDTDLDLLEHALSSNLEGSAYGDVFWVRKAIGWALRQHARTDPDWVRAYVAEHEAALSGLSKTEALKHL